MKKQEMKRVLIALDYDPTAQSVAETGFALAKAMNASIILLHVVADPVYYSSVEYSPIMGFTGYKDIDISKSADLKKISQYFLDKSKHHLGDENIETLVTEGDFAEVILNTAKDLRVDIIVMGSHSRRWYEDILMGNITEKVLRHTTIPLFIIPVKQKNS